MWLNIFGTGLLAGLALIAFLIILCFRRNLEPNQAMIIIMPTIIGVTFDNAVPQFVRNGLLLFAGAVIGLGILKYFGANK